VLIRRAVPLGITVALGLLQACAVFDGPPEVTIVGLNEGLLADPHAPIVLAFSKPPQPSTVRIEIAYNIVDSEDRLGDVPGNTLGTMGLDTIFTTDPVNGDTGGTEEIAADGSTMTITLSAPPEVGPQFVLLVEPGITDLAGTDTKVRREIPFGYSSSLTCNAPAQVIASGTFFFLVSVTNPVSTQIQLFGSLAVDPATGMVWGQFTKAKRNPDVTRCSPACPAGDVCQLLPTEACVAPSTVAASVDYFSDYVPNPDAPTGFSFANTGCAVDEGPTTGELNTRPHDVQVTSPMVTLRNTSLSSSFTADGGTLYGIGTLSADAVLLGTDNDGPSTGSLRARSIAPADVPPGVPPAVVTDAGVDGG
jgi:hypothetical protein